MIKEKTDLLKGSDVGECEQTGIFPDVLRLLFVQSESILHGPQQPCFFHVIVAFNVLI